MANKAYKFEAYPNEKQSLQFNKTFGCARFIYNHLLNDRTTYYKETKKTLKKEVSEYKKEFPFLKEVDSLALANAKINLQKAFDNFFNPKLKAKYPTFHKKGKNDSYTTNRVVNSKGNENISLTKNGIKLPKVGVVKIKQHRALGKEETIKSVTVSKKAGRFFISILVEFIPQEIEKVIPSKNSKAIGLDYSSPYFYVDSNGNSPSNIHFFRESEKKLAKLQHNLSRKVKGSSNYKKELLKIQKLHLHLANQRRDFAFKEANRLTEMYDIICFEDLNLSNLKRTLKLGKATSDNGFGMFRTIVKNKCEEKGKLFIKIDKFFPSSKKCRHCGNINKNLKLSDRIWTCPYCKNPIKRDLNAAINIKEEGLRIALL